MRVMSKGKTLFESFQENLKEATVDETWCQEQAEYYFNQDCQDSGNLDEIDYVDILNEYTSNENESKRVESLIHDAWKIIKDHIYYSDYKKYIELSDNHTLWQIDNDKFPNDDSAADEYNSQVEAAFETFKDETGVDLLALGRSGRHICVELNYENALKYSELVDKQQELEDEVISAMNSWEPEEVEESSKPEKEPIKEQDTMVRVITPQHAERDYCITDITELNKVSDGDVQPPIDITGLLVEVDERLTESYGEGWGQINFQSTRYNSETKDSNALFELCVSGGSKGYGKTYLMSMLLEENGKVLKVNNTKGKTIFKRKTNDVTSLAESYIKQFIPKDEKQIPDIIKHINEDLHSVYDFLMMQVDISKSVPKDEKDAFIKYLQGQMYAFVAEVSDEIKANEPNEDDTLELPSFDKMVEDIFGKEWVKEVKEPETKEVAGTETLTESNKTEKEYRIIDTKTNKVLKTFKADEQEKGYNEMRKMGEELKKSGKEDNLIYKEFTVKLKESAGTETLNESEDWEKEEPVECEILYDNEGKPYFMYNDEKEYIDDYIKDETGGAIKSLTAFSALRIVPSSNGDTVTVEYLHESNLNEGNLPNISEFIYNLDVDKGNAWSAESYTKNGKGDKIIIVSRNGQSENTAEDIIKAVEEKYPKLKGEPTINGRSIWFYLKEDSLNEDEAEDVPVADEPGEEKPEEPKNGLGTGYAAFTRKPKNLEMVEDKSNYFTDGEASYLICKKQRLNKDEFDKIKDNFLAPNQYCKSFEPLDLDNYSYNVIEFSCDDYDYKLLVDPSGYDYCRYVAKVGGNSNEN